MKNYLKIIKIDEFSITPKYLQIYNSVLRGIDDQLIEKGDIFPSIFDLSVALEVSRNTIERAYNELKKIGLLSSINGKGYFISNILFQKPVKILLLFNKLSSHKKIIYDSFAETLGSNAAIDFYIYNNDFNFFKKILLEKVDQYSKLVIIPHFKESEADALKIINELPKDKLILMDKLIPGMCGSFGAVFENFELDIYSALSQLSGKLSKYKTIKIIFPENSYYSKQILTGFENFCVDYAFNHETISGLAEEQLQPGTVYINLMEDDLVDLIEKSIAANLIVGNDIGVISYNETPLKKIILKGITTISTDFKMMGEKTARMVLDNSKDHLAIPFHVTFRNSI
ncbi:regulatory GntR family protein [Mucilaginibacter frigoritolerans]|uniref:Regulatory GntR family protein n=1 Tax=Mucilaginibacter frigoritolerans TaxID=652788 RepID=A0A562TQD3_9SPHI|nr:winged helix-turn-helix domain-containing protein [Mucilaginibacter frigoritolerans]TWI95306.1 regulatory GntR family protein [Mucilaginibacter frigoritolerans]